MKLIIPNSVLPYDCSQKQLAQLAAELIDEYSVKMTYGIGKCDIILEGISSSIHESLIYIGFQMGLMSEGR